MSPLADLSGTRWKGAAELWLDPLGDHSSRSDCTIAVDSASVRYTWSHEGEAHEGSITLGPRGADFQDTWHQKEPMECAHVEGAGGSSRSGGATVLTGTGAGGSA